MVVVGAGDIGTQLLALLEPFGARVVAVTRSGRPVRGAGRSVPVRGLDEALGLADFVVLAAPSTLQTRRLDTAALVTGHVLHADGGRTLV